MKHGTDPHYPCTRHDILREVHTCLSHLAVCLKSLPNIAEGMLIFSMDGMGDDLAIALNTAKGKCREAYDLLSKIPPEMESM